MGCGAAGGPEVIQNGGHVSSFYVLFTYCSVIQASLAVRELTVINHIYVIYRPGGPYREKLCPRS